ncbi:MAG: hypothetical protein NUV59_03920 [Patescibacteria group bacterium]|nr:hypothetical protein [Patescibacteria group bacterium]
MILIALVATASLSAAVLLAHAKDRLSDSLARIIESGDGRYLERRRDGREITWVAGSATCHVKLFPHEYVRGNSEEAALLIDMFDALLKSGRNLENIFSCPLFANPRLKRTVEADLWASGRYDVKRIESYPPIEEAMGIAA